MIADAMAPVLAGAVPIAAAAVLQLPLLFVLLPYLLSISCLRKQPMLQGKVRYLILFFHLIIP